MTWKNILLHIDGTARSAARLQLAVELARQHGARLTGVFAQLAEPESVGTVISWPPRAYVEASETARAAFDAASAGLAQVRWHDVNRGSEAEVSARLVQHARFADLVIMGQYDARQAAVVAERLVDDVIAHSGRPVLVMPYIGDFPSIGQRPLLAWTDSPGSARAIHEALPLIHGATAMIVAITEHHEDAQLATRELAENLAGHGISSRQEAFSMKDNEGLSAMDMILNRVTDHTADLLIASGSAGATGLFGGRKESDARHILGHMTVPVLLSS